MSEAGTGAGRTFADLLRFRRAAARLTQEDLAERAGLTPQAVGLLERGERRHPHADTVRRLAQALGLEGTALAEFEAASRRPAARAAAPPARRPLPAFPTPLVGRESEVAVAAGLLTREEVRLLTLTGPGGVGKTRLAVEVAARLTARPEGAFGDGAVFVPLASLRDPAVVPSALAGALGLREVAGQDLPGTLGRHLRERRLLVLLDNFEHLPGAAPLVADLLGACRGLKVLATSRAPLRLRGEHQFPVPPLLLPGADVPSPFPPSPDPSAAVELFCQRTRAVTPTFELTALNTRAVAQICRRLDGLPLAIELAAARSTLFPPQELLRLLDRRLPLLTGGARDLPERQQTMRGALAWSHDLLGEAEQALFRRLAVFSGGARLEAVEAVCGPGAHEPAGHGILETLAALIDHSLVESRAAPEGGEAQAARFTLLETIREYAAECLGSSGEADAAGRAHALHYLALAEATQPERLVHTGPGWWWARLEEEHDNLRAALEWAVRHGEAEIGTRFGAALWRFWAARHPTEGRRWLEAVLALTGSGDVGPHARQRAFLLLLTGILASRQGDLDRAARLYEESLTCSQAWGHTRATHGPLRELGIVAYLRGDHDRAVALTRQALTVAREVGSVFGAGLAVCHLSDALRARGELDQARALLEENLTLLRGLEPGVLVVNALVNTLARLGSLACELGEEEQAAGLFGESLGLVWRFVGQAWETVACLEGLGRVAVMRGQPEQAARLLGTSAALREELGTSLSPTVQADHDHAWNAARAALGETAFQAEYATGRAISLEEWVSGTLLGR